MAKVVNPNKLFRQRVRAFGAMRDLKQPKFTPFVIPTKEWAIEFYGKHDLAAYNYNYSLIEKVLDHLYDNIPMDGLTPSYPGAKPAPFFDALGAKTYKFPGRDLDVNTASQFPQNNIYMEANEYPEFIDDPIKFFLDKSIPRKHSNLRESPRKELNLIKGAMEITRYRSIYYSILLKIAQKYGIPPIFQSSIPTGPLDFIGDFLRTLTQLFIDIKRQPEEVKAAADAIVPILVKYGESAFAKPATVPAIMVPLHVGMFLRPKDFEEFYWPSFKKMAVTLINDGFTPVFHGESDWTPYIEFLSELPKGSIWLFEKIDWDRADEELTNLAFGGTIPLDLLRFGNPEKVISEVQSQIDKYSPRGGFFLCTPMPLMSIADAKPENVMALAKYLFEKNFM